MQTDYLNMLLGTTAPMSLTSIIGAMLLSFLLAFMYASVYQWTFSGFSYSKSFIQSMILGSMVTCLLIMAVGESLARGLGILGTLAIVRFRTPIRDPRDAMFLFACMGTGIACGSGLPLVAIGGTVMINAVALFLHFAPFASRREYEGLLRFLSSRDEDGKQAVDEVLEKHCESFTLIAVRDVAQGGTVEFSYHIRLMDPSYQRELLNALREVKTITQPVLVMHRTTIEV
jgi:uncharacterized membrane protein YhiD involved in acid resistance